MQGIHKSLSEAERDATDITNAFQPPDIRAVARVYDTNEIRLTRDTRTIEDLIAKFTHSLHRVTDKPVTSPDGTYYLEKQLWAGMWITLGYEADVIHNKRDVSSCIKKYSNRDGKYIDEFRSVHGWKEVTSAVAIRYVVRARDGEYFSNACCFGM